MLYNTLCFVVYVMLCYTCYITCNVVLRYITCYLKLCLCYVITCYLMLCYVYVIFLYNM